MSRVENLGKNSDIQFFADVIGLMASAKTVPIQGFKIRASVNVLFSSTFLLKHRLLLNSPLKFEFNSFLQQNFLLKNMKKMLPKVILCTLFIVTFTQPLGSSLTDFLGSSNCCSHNEIEVSGEGSAFGQPDISIISVRFSVVAQTSNQAVEGLSIKVNETILTLEVNGINEQDYETQSLNVFNEYSRGQIVGKRASQTITITVRELDEDGTKVAKLIDELAKIQNIIINSVRFDIFNKSPLQRQARDAAFQDAKQKATDYAEAAGVNIGTVITILDGQFDKAPPIQFEAQAFRLSADSGQTQIPVGELEVPYKIKVTFGLRLDPFRVGFQIGN